MTTTLTPSTSTPVSDPADPNLIHPHPPSRRVAAQEGEQMLAPLSSEQFNQSWWDDAACRDGEASLSGVFFSEELRNIALCEVHLR